MNDLEAIKREWLNQCGPCDYGMPEYGCTHPTDDYRPVMLHLVEEVEALRKREVDGLREAANDLQAMTTDPTDLLTESVGIKGPIAVALWLCDRANRIEAEAANAPA